MVEDKKLTTIDICECGHEREDHYATDGCSPCHYKYKYGKPIRIKKIKCEMFVSKWKATLSEIKTVRLHREDHGILTLSIDTHDGSSHQSYGGWGLDGWDKKKDRRKGTGFGTDCIVRLLDFFHVGELEEIGSKLVWTLRKSHSDRIIGLKRIEVVEEYKDNLNIFSFQDIANEWFPNRKND